MSENAFKKLLVSGLDNCDLLNKNPAMTQKCPISLSAEALAEWLTNESDAPLLIDVREGYELEIASFPAEVLHLPLSNSEQWVKETLNNMEMNKNIVVICHHGVRSLNFGIWLLAQSFGCEVWNLEGGIDSWSEKVDSEVPRY